MALSVVVLPAPLEPSSATTLPARHLERDVGDADEVAVAHLEMLDAEQRGHAAPRSARCRARDVAEVGLDHRRVAGDLARRAAGDLAALVEHHDALGERDDHLHDVLDDHERDAGAVDVAHQLDGACGPRSASARPCASSSSRTLGSEASARAISSRLRPGVPRFRAGVLGTSRHADPSSRARASLRARLAASAVAQEGADHDVVEHRHGLERQRHLEGAGEPEPARRLRRERVVTSRPVERHRAGGRRRDRRSGS